MTVLSIIITTIALVVGYGAYYFTKKPDTPIEQIAENVIEKESGLQIDISPDHNQPNQSVDNR